MHPASLVVAFALAALVVARKASAMGSSFTKYDSLFKKYGRIYGVPWRWIKAIAMVESNLGQAKSVKRGLENPSNVEASKSSDGKSWGIMQTILETARRHAGIVVTESWLNDAENSIRVGTAELARLIKIFGVNPEKVSRGYNGGPGYQKTALGPSLTLIYWGKFQKALEIVLKNHPGNVMELD